MVILLHEDNFVKKISRKICFNVINDTNRTHPSNLNVSVDPY